MSVINNKLTNSETTLLDIEENRIIHRWATHFTRHPQQLNKFHEADAELLPGIQSPALLATTIDTISEEIELKLYQDPKTIGRIAAIASLSDLAAVGATPIGILVSATLGKLSHFSQIELQEGIARGLEEACRQHKTFVLGGDTNFSDKTSLTVCALGQVESNHKLTRKGAKLGDLIYSTGFLGDGAALAAKVFYSLPEILYQESDYRPYARLEEGKLIADFASACMDTSDGLISTLDELSRINHLGVKLTSSPEDILNTKPRLLMEKLNLPALSFLAAQHGEFELIFTLPASKKLAFEKVAMQHNFQPILIGEMIEAPGVFLNTKPINSTKIRNLFSEINGDLDKYLTELVKLTS